MADTILVDLKDPETQAKVKAQGIRWRLKDYERGFEMDAAKAKSLGLKTVGERKSPPKPTPTNRPGETASMPVSDSFAVPPPKGPVFGGGKAEAKAEAKTDAKADAKADVKTDAHGKK